MMPGEGLHVLVPSPLEGIRASRDHRCARPKKHELRPPLRPPQPAAGFPQGVEGPRAWVGRALTLHRRWAKATVKLQANG